MSQKLNLILLFVFLSISSYAQIRKGYYFKDIKNTEWISNENFPETKIFNQTTIGLSLLISKPDTLKNNIWSFSDTLTITFYNSATNNQERILTCNYSIDVVTNTITFQIKDKEEVKFSYTSTSTGSYVLLLKEKSKKKRNRDKTHQ